MRRPPLHTIYIFSLVCLFLLYPNSFGQKELYAEVDLAKCWSYPLGDAAGEQITSDGSRIFIGFADGRIEALSLDGKKIWSSEFGGGISSNIVADDGGLYFVTSTVSSGIAKSGDSRLRSVSKETGITNWTAKLPEADEHFLHYFNGNIIVVSNNGEIQSIDEKQGGVKWKRVIAEGFAAEPEFTATEVIVAAVTNQIFTISMATGQINWMRKTAFGVTALAIVENNVLIAGDERGNIFLLNGADKPIWSFKTGGRISSIVAVDDHILAASHDNFVYFLAAKNGGRAWKRRLPGRVGRLAIIGDQYGVIADFDDHGGVLIDLSNGKVAGQIVLGSEETIVSVRKVISPGLPLFFLTNEAAYAFSLNGRAGCSK